MFEADSSWSLPEHLYLVSGWSAHCTKKGDPMSCRAPCENPGSPPHSTGNPTDKSPTTRGPTSPISCTSTESAGATTSSRGAQPDCADGQMFCTPVPQNAVTPGIWNPLPWFDTVREDGQLANVESLRHFFTALAEQLPARRSRGSSPGYKDSEHPPSTVTTVRRT